MKDLTLTKSHSKFNEITGINSIKTAEDLEGINVKSYSIDPSSNVMFKRKANDVIIRFGNACYSVSVDLIAYVYKNEKYNILVTKDGTQFPVFISLWELFTLFNSSKFEMFSSEVLVNMEAISFIEVNELGKVSIKPEPDLGMTFNYPCDHV